MHRGYIKLWRKTMDSQMFSLGVEYLGLLSHMLIIANYKKGWFCGKDILPGQIACGLPSMADSIGVSRSKLYRMLCKLQNLGIIEQRTNSKFTIITICNYSTYQGSYCEEKENIGQQVNSERTASEQQVNSERTQSKKDKKGKKEKNNTLEIPTREEVKAYCKENGFGHIADRAFCYYDAGNWTDGKGKPVKNWKQKLQSVWFNAEKNPPPPQEEQPDWDAIERVLDEPITESERRIEGQRERAEAVRQQFEKFCSDRSANEVGDPEDPFS